MRSHLSRREFLGASALLCLAAKSSAAESEPDLPESLPIIDIHQHTNYSGRTDQQLIKHQRALGITTTVLLPAGALYGLDAQCGGNQTVVDLARQNPQEFVFFANEITDRERAADEIRKYLNAGAIGIGEQKFKVDCDSKHSEAMAELAQEFGVPVLLHFQDGTYNTGIERFHKMLEKYPKVNFIGHAQTWWGNIDAKHNQRQLYPSGPVTRGGITDRLLAEYPNMYGDLSAGSGLNALIRDEAHTREFLERHQDKLLFGTDCNDSFGRGPACQGVRTLEALRRLAPSREALRKMLYANAARLLKLPATEKLQQEPGK